jgi:hypothetical protein
MRTAVAFGALTIALLGASHTEAQDNSPAAAEQQSFPATPQRPGSTTAPDHTIPPPPHAQPQAPIADQSKPAAVGPAQANTASIPAGSTPLGATDQTMPSTISEANAELDKKPITALQFPLTDQQKRLIAKSVIKVPKVRTNPDLADVHTAMFLPIGAPMQAFSDDLTQQVPSASRYKYVKLDDRVLIVDPTNLTVVGEIKL